MVNSIRIAWTLLYGWYCIPITLHKVLIDGSTMLSEAILPISLFAIFIFESSF